MSQMARKRAVFVVAPGGAVGGGMGRVKDYILAADAAHDGQYDLVSLVTRDDRGGVHSLWLLVRAVLTIWHARIMGRVAMVHVQFGDKGSAFRKGVITILARAAGVPVLLHLHAVELERHYRAANPLLRWIMRQPFRAATSVIVLGERWRTWLIEHLGIARNRIDVLHNGVPIAPRMRRIHEAKAEGEILFLGNMMERKGVSDLLHSLSILPVGAGRWHMTLAGGGDVERYRALSAKLGISDRVTFAGWVDQAEARRLLDAADMLLLPSYEEGLPLVILEALGSGTPVLCTPVGSIPEMLHDGLDVRFHPPGDREALAAGIAELLSDQALRQRLSDAGLDIFSRVFSLEAFQRSLFEIYRRRCGVDFPAAGSPLRHIAA